MKENSMNARKELDLNREICLKIDWLFTKIGHSDYFEMDKVIDGIRELIDSGGDVFKKNFLNRDAPTKYGAWWLDYAAASIMSTCHDDDNNKNKKLARQAIVNMWMFLFKNDCLDGKFYIKSLNNCVDKGINFGINKWLEAGGGAEINVGTSRLDKDIAKLKCIEPFERWFNKDFFFELDSHNTIKNDYLAEHYRPLLGEMMGKKWPKGLNWEKCFEATNKNVLNNSRFQEALWKKWNAGCFNLFRVHSEKNWNARKNERVMALKALLKYTSYRPEFDWFKVLEVRELANANNGSALEIMNSKKYCSDFAMEMVDVVNTYEGNKLKKMIGNKLEKKVFQSL